MSNEKMFHIVCIQEKTGAKTYMTGYPMNHEKCCIMMSKITVYHFRRIQLEEVK